METKKSQSFKKLSANGLVEKSIISAQFVKVYEQLRKDDKFSSDEEFCQNYGYTKHTMEHIRKGRNNVSIDLLYEVILEWKINPSFIFGLSEDIYAT
jgi:hypothetical protein